MIENSLREGLLHKSTKNTKIYKNTPFQIVLILSMMLLTYGLMAGVFAGLLAWTVVSPTIPLIVFACVFGVFFFALILLTIYGDRKRGEKEKEMIEAKLREKDDEI